jgi:hypothetical protein
MFQHSVIPVKIGENFLLCGYHSENRPLMILFDDFNLEALQSAPVIMCDETFEYCPREFYNSKFKFNGKEYGMCGQTYKIYVVFSDLPHFQSSFLSGRFFKKSWEIAFK